MDMEGNYMEHKMPAKKPAEKKEDVKK